MRALSIVSIVAALFGAFLAWLTYQIMCFDESSGSTMCPYGDATLTMTMQLVLGLVGVLPPIAMAVCSYRGAKRGAIAALIAGLALWAGWGVLNDAAVHGWDSDMRLLP